MGELDLFDFAEAQADGGSLSAGPLSPLTPKRDL